MNPLIIIGGATGSGKTALALELAQRYPELVILSADSRQVYKRLDIGSAKVGVPGIETALTGTPEPVWYAESVPQYLIDIADPNTNYTVAEFQQAAYRLIRSCWQKRKIPLLVGGTGLYLQAVAENYQFGSGSAETLRRELERLPIAELQRRVDALGGGLNSSDYQNPRRLIRVIERTIGEPSITHYEPITDNITTYVLERPWAEQRSLAPAMVNERLELGLVSETKQLLAHGVDKNWLRSVGLSYRLVIRMLDGEFSLDRLPDHMVVEFRQLMRRQRAWFNRMPYAERLSRNDIIAKVAEHLSR